MWHNPSFSKVVNVIVCLIFLNSSPFARYGGFDFKIDNLFIFHKTLKFEGDLFFIHVILSLKSQGSK
jgi:hypothetical protein